MISCQINYLTEIKSTLKEVFSRLAVYFTTPRNKLDSQRVWPQHFLYFFPEPHGQGALRPILSSSRCAG